MIELKALDIMQYCSLYSLEMTGNTCNLLDFLGAYRTYVGVWPVNKWQVINKVSNDR